MVQEDFKAVKGAMKYYISSEFSNVREALENAEVNLLKQRITMVPSATVELDDASAGNV